MKLYQILERDLYENSGNINSRIKNFLSGQIKVFFEWFKSVTHNVNTKIQNRENLIYHTISVVDTINNLPYLIWPEKKEPVQYWLNNNLSLLYLFIISELPKIGIENNIKSLNNYVFTKKLVGKISLNIEMGNSNKMESSIKDNLNPIIAVTIDKEILQTQYEIMKSKSSEYSQVFHIDNETNLEELFKNARKDKDNSFYDNIINEFITPLNELIKDNLSIMNLDDEYLYLYSFVLCLIFFKDISLAEQNLKVVLIRPVMFSKDVEPTLTFFGIYTSIEEPDTDEINYIVSKLCSEVSLFFHMIRREDDLRKESLKSAISAIMSRNGSHNIGSHVLSSVGCKLNDPVDMQTLTKYIQQRWDFLAQVTSGFPQWSIPVKLIAQLLRGFYEQRLLLNNIVLSEGLLAQEQFDPPIIEKKLQIEVLKFNKDTNELKLIWDYLNKQDDHAQVFHNDIDVAIPGGVTGFQAFYTILENYIRNSAKHAYKQNMNQAKGLKISIEFEEMDNYVEFFIYDNIPSNKGVLKNLNDKIKNSLLDENGQLTQKDWGIAEMKIAASYLRMIDFVTLDQNNTKEEESTLYEREKLKKSGDNSSCFIIKAELKNSKYLGYKFVIPKPKDILILSNEEKAFKNAGVFIKKISSVKENLNIHQFTYVVANKNGENDNLLNRSDLLNAPVLIDKIKFEILSKLDYENNKFEIIQEHLNRLKKAILIEIIGNSKIEIHIDTSDDFKASIGVNNEEIWAYFINKIGKRFHEIARLNLTESEKEIINNFFAKIDSKDMSKNSWKIFVDYLGSHHKTLYNKILLSKHTVEANYSKYEEDIETVPPYYKLSNSKVSVKQGWENFINKELNIKEKIEFINDYTKDKEKNIVMKRHFSLDTKYKYAESLSGAQSYFNYLHRPPEKFSQKVDILIDIIKTARYSIKIIDERFEEFMDKAETSIKNRINACKIECIRREELNKKIQENNLENDSVLIIHLGILQKQLDTNSEANLESKDSNENDNKGKIENLIKNLRDSIAHDIYVTSGKGDSEEIPESVKFIPFADIQSTLMKAYPEKMILVKILSNIKA
ncbi:MAG: hypothetical protein P1P88_02690 [Bacteroidales bacterium]|nr:hypothetical protein [Bacteroidales bacterium]